MKLLLIAFLFGFQTSFGQTDSTIYISEFGWTMKLPSDLKIIDPKVTVERQREGIKLMEGTIDKKIDSTDIVQLISAGRDKGNFFVANYSTSKQASYANYDSTDNAIKKIFFTTLRSNIAGNFDTLSTLILLDGIKFNKYQVDININEKVKIYTWVMTTFYKNYFLSVSSVCTDKVVGDEITKMFQYSKFDK
jgi:hypothetical protein